MVAHLDAAEQCGAEPGRDPPELWSVCDSTGILHRLAGPLAAEGPRSVLPQRVLLDDGGTSHLPAKSEWMAVKDGLLHVGGHGKEWVSGGVIRGRGAEWVRARGFPPSRSSRCRCS